MDCPNDGTTLLMSERQGIEIDYCPECRGVWLDRGELDKLIERTEAEQPYSEPRREEHRPASGQRGEPHGKRKRHKSMLSELFELGG